jgi:hypothetical protein
MKATKPPARVEPTSWDDDNQRQPDHDSDLDSNGSDRDGTTRTRYLQSVYDDEGGAAWQTV